MDTNRGVVEVQFSVLDGSHPPALHLPEARDDLPVASPATLDPQSLQSNHESHPSISRLRSHMTGSHLSPVTEDPYLDSPRANFSLLGAVEFRDVVNSLRKESASRLSTPGRSPLVEAADDYFGSAVSQHRRSTSTHVISHRYTSPGGSTSTRPRAHSHARAIRHDPPEARSVTAPPTASKGIKAASSVAEPNPWEDQPGHPPTPQFGPVSDSPPKPSRPRIDIDPTSIGRPGHNPVPSISIFDPTGVESFPTPSAQIPSTSSRPRESRLRIRHRIRTVLRILFPSLRSFRHKSYLGMFLGITSVPAILALTLTLPVVDDGRRSDTEGALQLPIAEDEPLADPEAPLTMSPPSVDDDFSDSDSDRQLSADVGEELHHLVDGFSPLRSPLPHFRRISELHDSILDSEHDDSKEGMGEAQEDTLDFNKYLTATQCVLGPLFCALVIFRESPSDSALIPRGDGVLAVDPAWCGDCRGCGERRGTLVECRWASSALDVGQVFCRVCVQYGVDCGDCG